MKETEWVDIIRDLLQDHLDDLIGEFEIKSGYKLHYGHEIRSIANYGYSHSVRCGKPDS